jgi:hypothetical protein
LKLTCVRSQVTVADFVAAALVRAITRAAKPAQRMAVETTQIADDD